MQFCYGSQVVTSQCGDTGTSFTTLPWARLSLSRDCQSHLEGSLRHTWLGPPSALLIQQARKGLRTCMADTSQVTLTVLIRGPHFENRCHRPLRKTTTCSDPAPSLLLGNKDHGRHYTQERPSQGRDDRLSPHNCGSLGTEAFLLS